MAPIIKKVTIAGATSTAGAPIFKALVESNLFFVTVLTRKGSTHVFPLGVIVKQVDYTVPELTEALRGQHALINATDIVQAAPQINLIDAAIAAGVYRYMPSEWGLDNNKPAIGELPIFSAEYAALKHMREKCSASGCATTYTDLHNGGLMDWGFITGFTGIRLHERFITVYDSGANEIAYTTREWVGKAVVGVLTHLEETANRSVFVANTYANQNKFIALTKEVLGGDDWTVIHRNTEEMLASSMAKVESGNMEMEALLDFIHVADTNPRYETKWKQDDNKLLGVPVFSDEDIKTVIKNSLSEGLH